MDARALRNAVEHYVAELPGDEDRDRAFKACLLAFGQTFVGIYEELAGIRRALEGNPEEHS